MYNLMIIERNPKELDKFVSTLLVIPMFSTRYMCKNK